MFMISPMSASERTLLRPADSNPGPIVHASTGLSMTWRCVPSRDELGLVALRGFAVVEDELVAFGVFAEGHVTRGRIGDFTILVEFDAACFRVADRFGHVIDGEHHGAARAALRLLAVVQPETVAVGEGPLG